MYFSSASEMKDSLNLKFGGATEDDFLTRYASSEVCIQGLEEAIRREKLFPSPPRRRRVNRCLPGFSWQRTELRGWGLRR